MLIMQPAAATSRFPTRVANDTFLDSGMSHSRGHGLNNVYTLLSTLFVENFRVFDKRIHVWCLPYNTQELSF